MKRGGCAEKLREQSGSVARIRHKAQSVLGSANKEVQCAKVRVCAHCAVGGKYSVSVGPRMGNCRRGASRHPSHSPAHSLLGLSLRRAVARAESRR